VNETQSTVYKNVSTLKPSFGSKPNVLQCCPLCHFYVANVIQPVRTLLMFNRFIHMIKVLARHKSYYIYSWFIWRTTFVLLEIPFILFKAPNSAILHFFFYWNGFPGKLPHVNLPRSISFVLNKKEIKLLFRKSYILT
jgi:hypothetical protein